MNKLIMLPAAAFCAFAGTSCSTTTNEGSDNDTTVVMNAEAPSSGARTVRTQLAESDSYIDLRTGQPLRIRMGESGLYTAESGDDLDLYVNTTTRDTFYRGEAFPVSGHVMRNPGGAYAIDENWFNTQYSNTMTQSTDSELPMTGDAEKVRMEEDGDYKLKNKEGDIKEKLKVDADGKDVKYKYKNDATDTKIKMTEDQIKISDPSGKTEIESDGSVKQKPR